MSSPASVLLANPGPLRTSFFAVSACWGFRLHGCPDGRQRVEFGLNVPGGVCSSRTVLSTLAPGGWNDAKQQQQQQSERPHLYSSILWRIVPRFLNRRLSISLRVESRLSKTKVWHKIFGQYEKFTGGKIKNTARLAPHFPCGVRLQSSE